jgi:protein-tyrosine phosphatase
MFELAFAMYPVDDENRLFISPAIPEWSLVSPYGVDTVIDLDGGLDHCIPTLPNTCLYVYFPIFDDGLPTLAKLRGVGRLGASLLRDGHVVLSHCGMGFNRSALVAGLILHELGMPGREVVARLRERRPGALFNENFAAFLEGL